MPTLPYSQFPWRRGIGSDSDKVFDGQNSVVANRVGTLDGNLIAAAPDLLAALIWCSDAKDFAPDGAARKGWEEFCQPLIDKLAKMHSLVSRATRDQVAKELADIEAKMSRSPNK